MDLDAAALEILAEQIAGRRVELAVHQMAGDMQDHDIHSAQAQAGSGFEPEQTTTDHDGLRARQRGGVEHPLDVVDIAERNDAFEVLARQRQDERERPSGDQELVVSGLAGLADHYPPVPVNLRHRLAEAGLDVVRRVPGIVMGDDLVVGLFAGKHRREHQAVVVTARLGVEERDLVPVGIGFEQVLEGTPRRHAGTDNDEFL